MHPSPTLSCLGKVATGLALGRFAHFWHEHRFKAFGIKAKTSVGAPATRTARFKFSSPQWATVVVDEISKEV